MITNALAQPIVETLELRRLLAASGSPPIALVATGTTDNGVVESAPDGRILVARDGFLYRYTSVLNPDISFGGGDGVVDLAGQRFPTKIVDIKLTVDGKILLAGISSGGGVSGTDLTVARLNSDGSLDTTFGGIAHGYANTADGVAWADFGVADEAHALAVAFDGRIAIVGDDGQSSAVVAIFKDDGSLDTGFDADGKLVWAAKTITGTSQVGDDFDGFYGRAAAFGPNGHLIVGGYVQTGIDLNPGFVVDFSPDLNWIVKSLSTTGAINWSVTQLTGITEQGRVADLAVLANGSILAAGTDNHFMRVAKFDQDGALITTFGDNGISLTPVESQHITGGERGASRMIARFDGSFDLLGHNGPTPALSTNVYLGRYNADGKIDASFGNPQLGGLRLAAQGSTLYAADFARVGQSSEPVVLINRIPQDQSQSQMQLTYTTAINPATAFVDRRGFLKIVGSDFDDTMFVHRRTDGRTVVVLNGVTRSFPSSSIRRIYMYGLGGNDTIGVGKRMPGVYIDGGWGDDTLTGQSGNDVLAGSRGDDVLIGNAGNDILYGQSGRDFLRGDDGNDSLYGQLGIDTLHGEAGDDFLDGGDDTGDNIYGGSGSDTAVQDDKDSVLDVELKQFTIPEQ